MSHRSRCLSLFENVPVQTLSHMEEEEKDVVNNRTIIESIVEPSKSEEEEPLKKASVTNEVKRRVDDEPTKSPEEDPENSNIAERKEEQMGTPQPELKDPTDIQRIRPSRNDKEREIEWLDVEEAMDLVDTSEESVYESLIKEDD
ncbi:hypothetical protein Tco_0964965 [Tanacetum coccineum]